MYIAARNLQSSEEPEQEDEEADNKTKTGSSQTIEINQNFNRSSFLTMGTKQRLKSKDSRKNSVMQALDIMSRK